MSENQDESSKTEEPTPKRIERAHEQGQYAISREINNWLMVAACLVIISGLMPGILGRLESRLGWFIAQSYQIPMDSGGARLAFIQAVLDTLEALALPLAVLMAAGFVGPVFQNGVNFNTKPITPDLNKINPLNGFKRLFSLSHQGIEMAKNLVKLILTGTASYLVLEPMLKGVEPMAGMEVPAMLDEIARLSFRVIMAVLVVMTLIAAADLYWQRFDFMKKLRMTKQEIKDEYKQQEGDPIIKGRIRQIRMEKARRRMMAAVPRADVVVTNPTHYAVAMKYDPDQMGAPMVLAKGIDEIAFNIRTVAAKHDIPVVENPPLARALYASAEIDQEIPAEHYRAVAEVISYVFKLKGRKLGS